MHNRGSSLKSGVAGLVTLRHRTSRPEVLSADEPENSKAATPAGGEGILRWPADRPHPVTVELPRRSRSRRSVSGLLRLRRREDSSRTDAATATGRPAPAAATIRREPSGRIVLMWPPRVAGEKSPQPPRAASDLTVAEPVAAEEQAQASDAGDESVAVALPAAEEFPPVLPAPEKLARAQRMALRRRRSPAAAPHATREPAAGPLEEAPGDTLAGSATLTPVGVDTAPASEQLPAGSADTALLPGEGAGLESPSQEDVAGPPSGAPPAGESPPQDTVAGTASLSPEVQAPEPEPEVAEQQPDPADQAAAYDPIPERVPEPLRGMLVREQQVLHQLEAAFGPEDPGVLNSRSNLAYYLVSAGEYARAVLVQEKVASETARVLGDKHPHTFTARTRLAQWRKLAKKHRRSRASV